MLYNCVLIETCSDRNHYITFVQCIVCNLVIACNLHVVHIYVQFSSVCGHHCRFRAFADVVFPVPTFRDVWLRTVGAFETAKIASLCHK